MPVLLGGSPSSPANLDLRRWEGRAGQRRKERLAVYLKRCVCTGDITLKGADRDRGRLAQSLSESFQHDVQRLLTVDSGN